MENSITLPLPENTACVAHYSTLKALNSILTDYDIVLWATRYGHFKDEKEYVWAMDKIAPHIPSLAESLGEEYEPTHLSHPYILSLSNFVDDKTMWQAYGDDCNGLMLIFDRLAIYDYCNEYIASTGKFRCCMDVVYASEDDLDEKIAEAFNRYQQSGFAEVCKTNCIYEIVAFVKNREEYAFEGECRLVHFEYDGFSMNPAGEIQNVSEHVPSDLKLRNDGKELKPYVEIHLPKHALVGVCLGPNVATKENIRALNLYLRSKKYNARVFKSNIQL